MRKLTILGRIAVVKSLAISKIIRLVLITNIHSFIIDHLVKIQKDFIWERKKPKIKHTTLCNNYGNGGLKSVNISLQNC